MNRRAILLGCAMALTGIAGCLGSEGPSKDSAFVSFSEQSGLGVGIEVSKGEFESIWVEIEGVDGGFMIYEGLDRPSVYVDNQEYSTAGDVCFKPSINAGCVDGSLDDETRNAFAISAEFRVYGVHDGEKTVLKTYERN